MPHKDKETAKKYHRDRYHRIMQENPDSNKDYYKLHREKLIQRSRHNHLKISYNMSEAQYQQMIVDQENKCAICGCEEVRKMKNGKTKPLSIDHNHTTGAVRKLLCNDCNAALGFAKEDPVLLLKMVDYLRNYNE